MDTTMRRLRKIRDVAGSVAVGTVGGSVAAVSTVLPSQGGAIGTCDATAMLRVPCEIPTVIHRVRVALTDHACVARCANVSCDA
jgi:hypothetical protein